jgi:hypothetical protein
MIAGPAHQSSGQWPEVPVPGVTDTPRRTWPDLADWTVWKLSPDGADVALTWSVIATSLFGSAPWSPPPLTVEVMAQIVTVPFGLTRPVMCRGVQPLAPSPSVGSRTKTGIWRVVRCWYSA